MAFRRLCSAFFSPAFLPTRRRLPLRIAQNLYRFRFFSFSSSHRCSIRCLGGAFPVSFALRFFVERRHPRRRDATACRRAISACGFDAHSIFQRIVFDSPPSLSLCRCRRWFGATEEEKTSRDGSFFRSSRLPFFLSLSLFSSGARILRAFNVLEFTFVRTKIRFVSIQQLKTTTYYTEGIILYK